MQFNLSRKRNSKIVTDKLSEIYHHDLSMYRIPPGHEITLSEFEDLALERLQLLRTIEQATLKGHRLYSEDWKKCVQADLRKENLQKYLRLIRSDGRSNLSDADLQARRADHISHFILRLAYCRSDDLRRWFVNREVEFFKFRFISLNRQNVESFLALNNLVYAPISVESKEAFREKLASSTSGFVDVDSEDFYEIPFADVFSLVKNRRVYVHKGVAFVPSFELVTCILNIFRTELNERLAYTNFQLPSIDDDRLSQLLNNLHNAYLGRDYTSPTEKDSINIACIDQYSRQHFPLCMRHIHEFFRANHHIKHDCRMIYGSFLKAIGVTFEDAMQLWREEFTKKIDNNQFDKQYAYGIKHRYGKVGKMVSYSPYSCTKIIMGNVGPGEQHGCPFKHWDGVLLQQKCREHGINAEGVQEILELSRKGHYQVACGKYYEVLHGRKNIINHPNQYFEESAALMKEKNLNAANTLQRGKQPQRNVSDNLESM